MDGTVADRRLNILAVLSLFVVGCGHTPTVQLTGEQSRVSLPADGSIAITNVTLVDVASGAREAAVTVVTKAGLIADIGRGISIPREMVRVDGAGKFLIPGLWDMHSHHQATGGEALDLFLASGVVGTRDMGADLEFILPLRERINRGELLGPEIVASGPILDDAPPEFPFRRRVTSAEEAREAVRELKARGVDFIKVHDHTPREAYFAIAEEAPKLGLPFAGHVPITSPSKRRPTRESRVSSISQTSASSPNVLLKEPTARSAVSRGSTNLRPRAYGKHQRWPSFEPCRRRSRANPCPTLNTPAMHFSSSRARTRKLLSLMNKHCCLSGTLARPVWLLSTTCILGAAASWQVAMVWCPASASKTSCN